jgi:hypothetical protein
MPDNMITGPKIKNKKKSIYFRFPFDSAILFSYHFEYLKIEKEKKWKNGKM